VVERFGLVFLLLLHNLLRDCDNREDDLSEKIDACARNGGFMHSKEILGIPMIRND